MYWNHKKKNNNNNNKKLLTFVIMQELKTIHQSQWPMHFLLSLQLDLAKLTVWSL